MVAGMANARFCGGRGQKDMPRAAKWIDPRSELLPADTIGWSFLRKAAIIRGIRAGAICREHAFDLQDVV
jgi:hypothetical protein